MEIVLEKNFDWNMTIDEICDWVDERYSYKDYYWTDTCSYDREHKRQHYIFFITPIDK